MQKFQILKKVTEYKTASDQTNTEETVLVTGSQNSLIDGLNGKVRSRPGYTRTGVANTALTEIRNGFTWNTSKGSDLPVRFYDTFWEVWLGTVDTTVINAWTKYAGSRSSTAVTRATAIYDSTEAIDILIHVEGTPNLIEWNGAVAVVGSIPDGTHITKAGTTTWAQNRFYTTRNKSLTCVRTGTLYTYTAGEGTTNLTVTDSSGLVAGDILTQTIISQSNKPASTRNNHTIFAFQNQIFVGSEDDEVVYISKNTAYTDFAYSAPRVPGEGGLLTLTDPTRGFGALSSQAIVFCGPSTAFKVIYTQITVGSTLTEALTALPLKIGVNQGLSTQETLVQVGNGFIYLSNEPAVRQLDSAVQATEPQMHALSNPIKPDMDAEDFTHACAIWSKNAYWLSAPANSRVYILEFIEDADGKLRRFWQPPQILPFRAFAEINEALNAHSNSVPETYVVFDGLSDTASDDTKISINAIAVGAYRNFGDRANLKTFDEYYIEGEITASTIACVLGLLYDFGGSTQLIEETINGSDESILEEVVGASSLAQESLGVDSLAGLLSPPVDARKFRIVFEEAKEDMHELQWKVSTNDTDQYWSILAQGPNVTLSPRKDTIIRR